MENLGTKKMEVAEKDFNSAITTLLKNDELKKILESIFKTEK